MAQSFNRDVLYAVFKEGEQERGRSKEVLMGRPGALELRDPYFHQSLLFPVVSSVSLSAVDREKVACAWRLFIVGALPELKYDHNAYNANWNMINT